eukprot:scaffold25476_cov51-Prasinocladus_malaysianus.AAC.1
MLLTPCMKTGWPAEAIAPVSGAIEMPVCHERQANYLISGAAQRRGGSLSTPILVCHRRAYF